MAWIPDIDHPCPIVSNKQISSPISIAPAPFGLIEAWGVQRCPGDNFNFQFNKIIVVFPHESITPITKTYKPAELKNAGTGSKNSIKDFSIINILAYTSFDSTGFVTVYHGFGRIIIICWSTYPWRYKLSFSGCCFSIGTLFSKPFLHCI